MTWIGRLRARALDPAIRAREAGYAVSLDRSGRESIQLEALNREWARVLGDVPYHAAVRRRLDLPDTFRSLAEFVERVPRTTRDDVQRHGHEMASRSRPADLFQMTGGSTAQPARLPAWRSEGKRAAADLWLGRSWYGVRPDSRLFQIWGHSHLLGSGLQGRVNAVKRRVKDAALGYRRFSAYDLRSEALRQAGQELLTFAPEYVLGYSVALDLLAQANEDRTARFRSLGLEVAIATAEAFPDSGARERVARVLGCPVAMEYGAVECGVLAHEHPEGGYRAFWRSFLLEAERSGEGHHLLRVTTLTPRCFPLVRYELGDEIEPEDPRQDHEWAIARFRRVIGRSNDYLPIDGSLIHSEAFAHAVRPCPLVRGFQVVKRGNALRIRYTAEADLDPRSTEEIKERLRRIHPSLGGAILERVGRLPQTVAGKTRMVIVEPD